MSKFAFFHSPSEKSKKKLNPEDLLSPKLRSAWIPVSGPGFGLDRYQVQESFAPENLKPDHLKHAPVENPAMTLNQEDNNVSVTVPVMSAQSTSVTTTPAPRVYTQPENAFVNMGSWEESWVLPPVFQSEYQPECQTAEYLEPLESLQFVPAQSDSSQSGSFISQALSTEQEVTIQQGDSSTLTEADFEILEWSVQELDEPETDIQTTHNQAMPEEVLYQKPMDLQEPLNLDDLFPPDQQNGWMPEEPVVTTVQAQDPSDVIWEQVVCQVSPAEKTEFFETEFAGPGSTESAVDLSEQAEVIPLQMIAAEPELEVIVLELDTESPFQQAFEESAWELPQTIEIAHTQLADDPALETALPIDSFLTIPRNALPQES